MYSLPVVFVLAFVCYNWKRNNANYNAVVSQGFDTF